MAKLTLWALNRALSFLPGMRHALARRHEVRVGRRVVGATGVVGDVVEVDVNNDEQSALGELMHEGALQAKNDYRSGYDEYFVPIPVKCIAHAGSAFWGRVASAQGAAKLQAIARVSHAMGVVDHYWTVPTTISPAFRDVKMNTRFTPSEAIGLYEVLHRATRVSGAKNVLVGYSQGGVVARFLAFLDEHVVKPEERCIEAVITVQSPNRGSPVSQGGNERPALAGALLALLSVPRLLPARHAEPVTSHLLARAGGYGANMTVLGEVLDQLFLTLQAQSPVPGQIEFVRTARKWTSGLANNWALAFYDLDPSRLDEEHSVLSCIHASPTASAHALVKHGAVIGTNGVLIDFIDAMEKTVALWFDTAFMKLGYWLARSSIKRAVSVADDIYRNDVMSLHSIRTPLGPHEAQLMMDMSSALPKGHYGIEEDDIAVRDHDFVIPAASQLVLPGRSGFLGNLVNEDAGHLSGAERSDGDNTDVDFVMELLKRV